MDQTRPLSVYLCPLGIAMTNKVYNLTISSKNCGWCAWDLNPGEQDERMPRRRRVCWAIDVGPPAQVVFIFGAKGVSESLSHRLIHGQNFTWGIFSHILRKKSCVSVKPAALWDISSSVCPVCHVWTRFPTSKRSKMVPTYFYFLNGASVTSGQSYKQFMFVIYKSRFVICAIF